MNILNTLNNLDHKYSIKIFKYNGGILINTLAYMSSIIFMEETCVFTLGLIYILFEKKLKIYTIFFSCFLTHIAITLIGKKVIGRTRPSDSIIDGANKTTFFRRKQGNCSLPSGDSQQAWNLFIFSWIYYPEFSFPLFLIALFISFSRVYFGCHFISDIFASIIFAFIFTPLLISFLSKMKILDFLEDFSFLN